MTSVLVKLRPNMVMKATPQPKKIQQPTATNCRSIFCRAQRAQQSRRADLVQPVFSADLPRQSRHWNFSLYCEIHRFATRNSHPLLFSGLSPFSFEALACLKLSVQTAFLCRQSLVFLTHLLPLICTLLLCYWHKMFHGKTKVGKIQV